MLTINNDYTFENVWEAKPDVLKEEIITFWLREKALDTRQQAEQRVNQVVLLARDSSGQIAGICTAFPRHNPQLRHTFYQFRAFVTAPHRQSLIGARLTVDARDYFNGRFVAGHDPHIIGMLVEVENEGLRNKHNHAVWPYSGYVFIGYNQRGNHVRVYYFDEARIKP